METLPLTFLQQRCLSADSLVWIVRMFRSLLHRLWPSRSTLVLLNSKLPVSLDLFEHLLDATTPIGALSISINTLHLFIITNRPTYC